MRQLLISFLLLVFSLITLPALAGGLKEAASNSDSLVTELTKAIPLSAGYDTARTREITRLQQSLNTPGQSLPAIFDRQEKIYEQYKTLKSDSAYSYAIRLIGIAREMQDAPHLIAAQLKLSFILLSAGLYKETYDSLYSLTNRLIPDSLKGEYYTLWGRYYYDMAGYANDHYHSVDYDKKGNQYLDSALAFFPPPSFAYIYYSGLKSFKQNTTGEGASFFEKLLATPSLTDHQLALTASTLSAIYLQKGDQDKAIDLLIRATMADIRSSTKETVAIFHLAELLYKKGDLKHAVMCIESAIANAEFYGARQRKIQASSILPLIEGERINGIEAQKSLLIKYAILVTLLVLALIVLAWIILRQVQQLKRTQQALSVANEKQQVINHQLEESNKIKEEYIGYFFNMDSEFYNKLDKIKTTIEQKLQERRYDDIKFFLNKIDARKEKEELLLSFDKIFLKLFPNFVTEVNALLRDEEKIRLKEGELLTTDLLTLARI